MSGFDHDPVFELALDDSNTGMTDAEIRAFLNFTSNEPIITAAATVTVHTGAMIALVPSDDDIGRLVAEGGEEPSELHLTLSYLGEAADIPEDVQEYILRAAEQIAAHQSPITANGFSINIFNPQGEKPCIVLGVDSGEDDELADLHASVQSMLAGLSTPFAQNHKPWIPHVTLAYTPDLSVVLDLLDRTGMITFDQLRVEIAGVSTDFPLSGLMTAAFVESDRPRGPDGRWIKGDAGAITDRFAAALSEHDAWNRAPRVPSYASQPASTYAGESFREINAWMRSSDKHDRYGSKLWEYSGMQRDITNLTRGIENSPLAEDTVLWRGLGSISRAFSDSDVDYHQPMDGMEWEDDAFVSTTARREVTNQFGGPNSYDAALLRILAPAGTGAVQVGSWDEEAELLLGPKTRFRVVKDHGLVDNVRRLDVEVIPRDVSN